MKHIPLSEVKNDLSKYLREAEEQDIIITRHGKPAGVLVGFASEEDWLAYRLARDPHFRQRVAEAQASYEVATGSSSSPERQRRSFEEVRAVWSALRDDLSARPQGETSMAEQLEADRRERDEMLTGVKGR